MVDACRLRGLVKDFMDMNLFLTLACTSVLLLVTAHPAVADPYDPNESPATATVVNFNETVSGAIDTSNDIDWYVGRLRSGVQAAFDIQEHEGSCSAWLYNEYGQVVSFPLTTSAGRSGDMRFYIRIRSERTCRYSFSFTPGSASDQALPTAAVPEPADRQNPVPLQGGVTYRGAIEAEGDEDVLRAYAAESGLPAEINFVTDGCFAEYSTNGLSGPTETITNYGDLASDTLWRTTYGRVILTISGNPGCRYALRLSGPVTLTNPLICDNARTKLAAAKRSLRRHKQLARRHQPHKSLKRLSRAVDSARANMKVKCT